MNARFWLTVASLCLFAGCGMPPDVGVEEQALGTSCGAQSDPSCKGRTVGTACDTNAKCRLDPDYPGSCQCLTATPPPPPPPVCHCWDGSVPGSPCRNGGTCRILLGQEMSYCGCS